MLRDLDDVETHLVLSRWARTTVELETAYTVREVAKLADVVDHLVVRILDQFGISAPGARRWTGLSPIKTARRDDPPS